MNRPVRHYHGFAEITMTVHSRNSDVTAIPGSPGKHCWLDAYCWQGGAAAVIDSFRGLRTCRRKSHLPSKALLVKRLPSQGMYSNHIQVPKMFGDLSRLADVLPVKD